GSLNYSESLLGQPVMSVANLLLAKLDGSGNLVFCEVFGGIGIESGRCVAEAADGTLWVGGSVTEGPSAYGWLTAFEPNGALRFTVKVQGNDPFITTNSILSVQPLTGGVQLLGQRGLGAAHDAWLALVSDIGTPLGWKTIGGAAEDVPLGMR